MNEERYRHPRRAVVPASALTSCDHDPGALIACALWIALDAAGVDASEIEVLSASGAPSHWSFTHQDTNTDLDELLHAGSVRHRSDRPAPTASIAWGPLQTADDDQALGDDGRARLQLSAQEEDDEVRLEVRGRIADTDIDPGVFADLVAHVLLELILDSHRPAASVPLVSSAVSQWLDNLNDTQAPYPQVATIDELVRQVAAQSPDAVAVEDDVQSITYRELIERATTTSDLLCDAGLLPREAIGVEFPRSVDCVVAMLGVLFAGGVYVPIPLEDPLERRERLLGVLAVRFVLRAGRTGISLSRRDATGRAVPGGSSDDAGSAPLNVMFTSGSTGEPKGVVVPHRAVIRLLRDPEFVRFSPADRVGFTSNPGFDVATWEIWGTLCGGARLLPVPSDVVAQPRALESFLQSRAVTCLFLTTSLFHAHARTSPGMFGDLRVLTIAGEVRGSPVLPSGAEVRFPTRRAHQRVRPDGDRGVCELVPAGSRGG